MVDYPYMAKTSSLDDFLRKMATRPEPSKVTQEYLRSLGYTSSSDRQIIPVLRFINFIDASGIPTDLFKSYRDTRNSKAVMAQALKESYAEFFGVYASPSQATDDDLDNFFRTKTGRGDRMLEITVAAFKTLCQSADFAAPLIAPPIILPPVTPPTQPVQPGLIVQPPVTKEGININVNIRLELPATQDATVYDKIFESLKKHLLTTSSRTD